MQKWIQKIEVEVEFINQIIATRSQSNQTSLIPLLFRFLLLSLALLNTGNIFLCFKHSSLTAKTEKNRHFTKKKVW